MWFIAGGVGASSKRLRRPDSPPTSPPLQTQGTDISCTESNRPSTSGASTSNSDVTAEPSSGVCVCVCVCVFIYGIILIDISLFFF